jgi:hypothetical protein
MEKITERSIGRAVDLTEEGRSSLSIDDIEEIESYLPCEAFETEYLSLEDESKLIRFKGITNPKNFIHKDFLKIESYDKPNSLINAARGRDACGINHDEIYAAHQSEMKELKQKAEKLVIILRRASDILGHEGYIEMTRDCQQAIKNYEKD